ncbi:MAG: DUF1861 family protein [Defluviitaleaceae bacterium]|nr:DUF1861 family protein [Defluviitaleaceae bacterium]
MTFAQKKKDFDQKNIVSESYIVNFIGVEGFDVYNCSIPFYWNGKRYIYGRVERREEWARSWVRLFEETEQDQFTVVKGSMIYQLEDPYISQIGKELVLGGTHVQYSRGEMANLCAYFYKGTDLNDMYYFTTGPDKMKDIRLVELTKGIGVFSRPRGEEIEKEHGSGSIVGYAVIDNILDLDANIISKARKIEGMFGPGEWGGCNQCYRLDSGLIGIIGHKSYNDSTPDGTKIEVYVNVSFVFDPVTHKLLDEKILATRKSYPPGPAKKSHLPDCVFTAGIVMRDDGRADLYSGLGDTMVGRAVIENPFKGFGNLVVPL